MQKYKNYLPNLESLITFDAVARYQSFTMAADELCLTQPAVSQRIKLLEEEMAVQLFERSHKSIRLTAHGNEFHNSVVIALNHLVAASETLKTTSKKLNIKISTDVAMSSCWFSTRLAELHDNFPDFSFELIANDNPDAYAEASIDIAIIHGQDEWSGYKSELLFSEEVVPVCSPSFLKEIGPFHEPKELIESKLIDLIYEKWTWMNWTIWLSEVNVLNPKINRVFRSNLYDATIQAAKDGLGIALAWRYFVDPDLLDGTLVMPLKKSVKTTNGYYLLIDERNVNFEQIESVANWIKNKFHTQQLF